MNDPTNHDQATYRDRLDDLMDRYVFGLLDDEAEARVRDGIETDPEFKIAYDAACRRRHVLGKALKSGDPRGKARRPDPRTVIDQAKRQAHRQRRRVRTLRLAAAGLASAAVVIIGATWLLASVWPAEPDAFVRLVSPEQSAPGAPVGVLAMVADPDGKPLTGRAIELSLVEPAGGKVHRLTTWRSGPEGVATGEVRLPDLAPGTYSLRARAIGRGGTSADAPVTLRRASRVYVATDKPIYKPGQTLHLRLLGVNAVTGAPLDGAGGSIRVTDPSGTDIFAQQVTLSEFGIASADLPTDPLIRTGVYRVVAEVGGVESTQTVKIIPYTLPAFAVRVDLDRPYALPGDRVTGTVEAEYTFGKPVADGTARLTIGGDDGTMLPETTLDLALDANGQASFEWTVPSNLPGLERTGRSARLDLLARVTDPAQQENTGAASLAVHGQPIRITAVVEHGVASPTLPNRLFVVTQYPDGRPAKTLVHLETLGLSVRTDPTGAATVELPRTPEQLRLRAVDAQGLRGRRTVPLRQADDEGMIVRTDKPVYRGGQSIGVEVLSPRDGEAFLEVTKDRQTLLTRSLDVRDGRCQYTVDLPPDVSGTLRIRAYRLRDDNEWIGREALAIVRPARRLRVTVERSRPSYRPGDEADLVFTVVDERGHPVPSALALSAVDAAVFAVDHGGPVLETTLAGLDAELLRPAVEIHGLSPSYLDSEPYARALLAAATDDATLRALGPPDPLETLEPLARSGLINLDRLRDVGWPLLREQINEQLRANPDLAAGLPPDFREALKRDPARKPFGPVGTMVDNRDEASTAWRRRRRQVRDRAWTVTRTTALAGALSVVCLYVLSLALGDRGRLEQRPPDGRPGTARRLTALILVAGSALWLSTLLPTLHRARHNAQNAVAGAEASGLLKAGQIEGLELDRTGRGRQPGRGEAVPLEAVDGESFYPVLSKQDGGDTPPRTRSWFPETLLWRPELITDERGVARLTIPLADSITTWRLAGWAIGRGGQMGSVDERLRVDQPFFAEVTCPPELTRGDEVGVPVILYNYTGAPVEVVLGVETDGAIDLSADPPARVRVEPARPARAVVRVRADRIGPGGLTVRASAEGVADAIRRELTVVPPGLPTVRTTSGTLVEGRQELDVRIPDDAVEGSVAIRLKVYPSTFSELLDGMEGILRMPNGCFEQTSSTTYPNVLALGYMQANDIDTPKVRATARRYIHTGYQRLLSFEVSGGGFSLFGRSPADPMLTAYGLMEFVDMSKVHHVDADVLTRTATWLAANQNADGSWEPKQGLSHGPIIPYRSRSRLSVTAYITWALAAGDPKHPAAQLGAGYLTSHVDDETDPFSLALTANALLAIDPHCPPGTRSANRLAQMQDVQGPRLACWNDDVRTTALASQALLRCPAHREAALDGLRWLAARRDGYGTWGETQTTILALQAMLAGSSAPAPRSQDGRVVVADEGDRERARLAVPASAAETVQTVAIDGAWQPGAIRGLSLDARHAGGMGYQVVVHYRTLRPPSNAAAPVTVEVSYDRTKLTVGETVRARATVVNRTDEAAMLPLVDLGIPPGFTVRREGLDRLVEDRTIDRYTLTSRGIIVYLPTMSPRQTVTLDYDLVARLPLRARSAPTKVHPYYDPEQVAAAPTTWFVIE